MKKLVTIIIISLSLILCQQTFAQSRKSNTPKWISVKGYWVVEGNTHSPKENTIRFYTNENQLVYKETISGKKLKLQRKSVKMQLKDVLERSITDWATHHTVGENKDYVKAILH